MVQPPEVPSPQDVARQVTSPALERVLERMRAEDEGEEESLWSDFSSHNQK